MLRAMGLSLLLTELIELSAALLLKKREDIGLIALAKLYDQPGGGIPFAADEGPEAGLLPGGGRRDGVFSLCWRRDTPTKGAPPK